ncbi:beta-N-acetylhexosaminidase [Ancylobacter pratisalsi]|uniref:beta-N-acetylhexosaminidase n=1 Tax=Ancylobacter pratisalsi TaxID=1745854 RepID=A0A6P1YSF8_9HYPH|nr:beta-N-acetylhexosaminidase [Ancylobacter pratisalsi]QIB35626.1 beta-N-acetylhexosaminidase [Ancylobacter pratisalsi]
MNTSTAPRAFITGCAGTRLSAQEAEFLRETRPWGLILFRRNVETPEQVAALVAAFREHVGRSDAPVLIDQEGGRVQRLGPPHWPAYPPAGVFAALAEAGEEARAVEAARLGARLMADDLAALGITVDCVPCADLRLPEGHGIIGDRAYGETPERVALLARAAADGMMSGGVLPVLKHIPGHGRARADSHLSLPVVETSRPVLEATDFEAFRRLNDLPLGMTAHVVYAAIDADQPATTSRRVIDEIIRGFIGFDGALMSDDLSMGALAGSLASRAEASFAAGCDLALHCNGDIEEMRAVASRSPLLAGEAARRCEAALEQLVRPEKIEQAQARAHFSDMIAVS